MENASKAMIIIGAVIITVLLMSVGLFIYGTSQGLLKSTGESLSEQEILSFNQQWTYYDGEQTGDSVKDLLRRMIQNCVTNSEEQARLPGLTIDKACATATHKMKVTVTVLNNQATATSIDDNTTYYDLIESSDYDKVLKPDIAERAYVLVRNAIETRHIYYVSFEFSTRGIINRILINYSH